MGEYFQASGMTRQAIEKTVAVARPLILAGLRELIEGIAQQTSHLEVNCAQRVQLHEMVRLKEIPLVKDIDGWIEFKKLEAFFQGSYIRAAKEAFAASPHLYELGALAVAYAKAYKAESYARGQIQEAGAYAGSAWGAIKLAAQDPEFATKGVALIPGEKSWLGTIKPYVWPF